MRKLIYLFPLLIFASCGGNSQQQNAIEQPQADVPVSFSDIDMPIHQIPLPEIPDSLTRPSQRADYLLLHYWETLDFNDAEVMNDNLLIEQTFSNFIELLPYTSDLDVVAKSIANLYKCASVNATSYQTMAQIAEKYLYTPDSPMRSPALYEYFIDEFVKGKVFTVAQKQHFIDQRMFDDENTAEI